jgi:uncharacterized membrane protein
VRVNWRNAFAVPREALPEDREFIGGWASAIQRRHMAPAAILLLEMAKPFSWLFMNVSAGAEPLLSPFLGTQRTERISRFFNNRENLEYLIQLLEEGNKRSVKK